MAYANKEDARAYKRKWYQLNKEKHMSESIERKRSLKRWLDEYKTSLKCEICGMNHPGCLEFHHLDPTIKEKTIGLMIAEGYGKKAILKEISKCIPLCANCHAILHYNERHNISNNKLLAPLVQSGRIWALQAFDVGSNPIGRT